MRHSAIVWLENIKLWLASIWELNHKLHSNESSFWLHISSQRIFRFSADTKGDDWLRILLRCGCTALILRFHFGFVCYGFFFAPCLMNLARKSMVKKTTTERSLFLRQMLVSQFARVGVSPPYSILKQQILFTSQIFMCFSFFCSFAGYLCLSTHATKCNLYIIRCARCSLKVSTQLFLFFFGAHHALIESFEFTLNATN